MLIPRVIPCLLLKNGGLVKTVGFANPKYVGDPINAVRIFNEKEVDELILLDIDASRQGHEPNYSLIQDVVSEAFMPVAYGGGVSTVDQARRLVGLGVEKIVINSAVLQNLEVVKKIADTLGSQSVVVAVDIKKNFFGQYRVFNAVKRKTVNLNLIDHVQAAVAAGAGEMFLNDVRRDGTGEGYDLELLGEVTRCINVPVISSGGAGTLEHFGEAVMAGASAVAAGSMFVYVGKHRAVMINYPEYRVLQELFRNA